MPRKYTDSNFVIQTTANISSQWSKASNIGQIPFSLTPFTVKSATSLKVCPSAPFGTKAYIVAQRPNPRDFLFETEKLNLPYRWTITSTTVTAGDRVIGADTTLGPLTVTLATAASVRSGFVLTVKDEQGTSAADNITIARSASDTIDGLTSIIIATPYASVDLVTDGVNKWYII